MSTPQDQGPDVDDSGITDDQAQAHQPGDAPEPAPVVIPPAEPQAPKPDPGPAPDVEVDEAPARLAYLFHNEASPDEEVSLPGYMSPTPSIVRDGTVFAVDGGYAADLSGGRFEALGEYDAAVHSPLAQLTDAELADKFAAIPEAHAVKIAEGAETREHLIQRLEDYDKANPQPPGNPGDVIEESTSE